MIKKLLIFFLGFSFSTHWLIAEDSLTLKDRYFDLLARKGGNRNITIDDHLLKDEYISFLLQNLLDHETMIGLQRLHGLWNCMKEVEENKIPGDFIETGVWKGGATIFMNGFLKAYGNSERRVWVCDSFQGFPPTTRTNELSCNNQEYPSLVVSLEEVKGNFAKYNLLDNQVCFLKGFFGDTLPNAPIEKLALLRLDGDLYQSTMDALTYLYPKLSIGGYIIIDDYGHWPGCADAVNEYRQIHNIDEPFYWEDYTGIHWKKTHE